MKSRKHLLAFLALLLLAAVLRLFELEERSLWLDEFTSLEVASHSLSTILGGSVFDNHTPPFYYLILHGWFEVFSNTPFFLRLFSLVLDLANLLLVVYIFSRHFDRKIGFYTGLLYALSPYAVYYGQEGRMYTLAVLFVLICYLLVLRIRDAEYGIWTLLAYVLVATLAMYTHYYCALALLGIGLAAVFELRKDPKALLALIVSSLCVLLAFIPWIQVVFTLLGGEGQHFRKFVLLTLPYSFIRFVAGYAIMPLNYGAKDDVRSTFLEHLPLLVPYLIVFLPSLLLGLRVLLKDWRRERVFVLSVLLLVPLLASLISLFKPMLSERYLIVIYPFFLLLIALAFSARPKVFIIPLALFCFGLYQHYQNKYFGNTQWQEASSVMMQLDNTSKCALINPDYLKGLLDYYLDSNWRIYLPKEVSRLNQENSCWLVERGTAESLKEVFVDNGFKEKMYKLLPLENGIRLFLWERS